ncbi:MAG: bifunctional homocysteine S-methyltransferase/methylenetetrahydrofolate reductase [Candidatus Desulfofervidaceae bacterium]|nr:bifunctional homocysteine S-methyltransferase/methylenetetrahydrofolate reductase [Candidatus Desulfofervidaceae bacterium]
MTDFLQALKEKVLLSDGAMGTMLYKKGVYINRCFDEVNLSAPGLVQEIHIAYAKAGADILSTNTFGANYWHLKNYGLEDKIAAINKAGVKLAREIAGKELFVAGTVGPVSPFITPPFKEENLRKGYEVQINTLAEAGIDFFILESFVYLEALLMTIRLIQEWTDIPIVAEVTIEEGEHLLSGEHVTEIVTPIENSGVVAWGFNCSQGPRHILRLIDAVWEKATLPLVAQPSAGLPQKREGRKIYFCTPEYLASHSRYYIQKGVKIVGGCCGTTPEHIKAVRSAVHSMSPGRIIHIEGVKHALNQTEVTPPVIPLAKRSAMAKKIATGQFVTNVELTPPRSSDASKALAKAQLIKEMGIDAINIPDGPRASARMSAHALAVLIEQKVGIETVLHVCCRDRNLIGLQADLLGGYALGLRNLLIITGDPPKLGDYPDATAVFDLDSIGLVRLAQKLNRGQDLVGRSIGGATGFLIGVGVNPVAVNVEREIERFEAKVKAGAEFAITQPVFDIKALESFITQVKHLNIPIIAGIWPLTSYKAALFMKNEVPGVSVPDEIVERMAKSPTGEAAIAEGVAIAREAFEAIKDLVQGVQISAPLGKVEMVAKVLGLE